MDDKALVETILRLMPYAAKLAVSAEIADNGRLVGTMPFHENHIGNAQLPALHGGSLASFMEITAILELARRQAAMQQIETIEAGRSILPLPVNVSVQYLRSAGAEDCFAEAEVLKVGRRTSTVFCKLWQANAAKPVASMTGIFIQPKN